MDAVLENATKSPFIVELKGRVREILKALKGPKQPEHEVDVPKVPGDPDEIMPDQRVGDASPTDADLKDAKEDAAPPPSPPMEEGADDGDGDEGGGPGDGDGDGDGDENGGKNGGKKPPFMKALGDGFDTFGNADLGPEGIRAMEKAYGNGTGKEEPQELLDGGADLQSLLIQLLNAIEDSKVRTDMVLDEVRAEVARLKAGQSVSDRKISKALEDIGQFATTAPKPRAIIKALPEAPAAPEGPTSKEVSNQIFRDLRAGKMSVAEATAKARALRTSA